MQFLERHPVKVQVATAITVIIFIVSGTAHVTGDRGKALAAIAASEERILRLEKSDMAMEKLVCQVRDEFQAANRALQAQMHNNDIASTEIKVRLTAVEAILIKIDQKLEKRQ